MKTLLATLIILVAYGTANAEYRFAENWSKTDTTYQATFLIVTTVDWMQTRWMVKQDWKWDGEYHREMNPILGSHPSIEKVDTLIPLGMIAHTLVSMALPPAQRRIWQCLFIIGEVGVIGSNASLGVKLDF